MFGTFGFPVEFYRRGFVAADLTLPASLSIDGEGGARRIGGSMSQFDDGAVVWSHQIGQWVKIV